MLERDAIVVKARKEKIKSFIIHHTWHEDSSTLTDHTYVCTLCQSRQVRPGLCVPTPIPHSISQGRETLSHASWEAKACCQFYFSLTKRSLGSAECGKTKETLRGFSQSCLLAVFLEESDNNRRKSCKRVVLEITPARRRQSEHTAFLACACPSVWLVSPAITCIPLLPPPSAALCPAARLATSAN